MRAIRAWARWVAWLAVLLSMGAGAMQIHSQTLEEVMVAADSAVVAEVKEVSAPRREGFHEVIDIVAMPRQTLYGQPVGDELLHCRYSEGLPHQRGETRVSPLVSGSGMEAQVKAGDVVVLLLAGRDALLRVEPLLRADYIVEYARKIVR